MRLTAGKLVTVVRKSETSDSGGHEMFADVVVVVVVVVVGSVVVGSIAGKRREDTRQPEGVVMTCLMASHFRNALWCCRTYQDQNTTLGQCLRPLTRRRRLGTRKRVPPFRVKKRMLSTDSVA